MSLTNGFLTFPFTFFISSCPVGACPVGALAPYKADGTKCLVGMHLIDKGISKYAEEPRLYEPSLSKNSHLMCRECQKACRYGKEKH